MSAATSTNAIPNLHGGAHPATPKLAGIICGAGILFAWTLCLIYWVWQRRRENQDIAEILANEKAGVYDKAYNRPVIHPTRRRAAAERLERIESAEKHKQERHKQALAQKEADELAKRMAKHATGPLIPNTAETDETGKHTSFGDYPQASTSGRPTEWTRHQLSTTAEEAQTPGSGT